MNRLLTLALIGLAGLLASCGSSVTSSTQPATNFAYSMVVTPILFTLNAGDWSSISAAVDQTFENGAPSPVAPQPTIKFFSSDPRITISPAGEVCAGQWDVRYLTCTPTVFPPGSIDPTTKKSIAGQPNLPTGYVTITAYDATRNVSATAQLSVHERAASIRLTSPGYAISETVNGTTFTRNCISQNDQVKYVATPYDASGTAIPSTVSNVFANDYTWTVGDSNVAEASTFGFVAARNPGVISVYATLNGTVSVPLTFVACPPTSIVLATSNFTGGTPVGPYSTADLDSLSKGAEKYVTATLKDINGNTLVTSPLNYTTSDPLTGSFSTVLPLTSKLTANTSGRFSVIASCEPPSCNAGVGNFIVPGATTPTDGQAAGFGSPIYSNAIGVTVTGFSGSSVLVTGDTFANSVTPCTPATPSGCIHRMEVYDSESLTNTHTVALANLPNSLVVSPDGTTAYVGSSDGLMVVNLTSYQALLQTYPILGGISTDVVTGNVLGVSPDSRYVVLSDNVSAAPNSYVFLIDTTGTKVATRYTFTGTVSSPVLINAVTFAADGSNMWIGGTNGVYVFNSDAFVKTATNISTGVKALAWMPDGQSYFASGSALVDYSTCNDLNPQTPAVDLPTSVAGGLATTALQGVPHLLGLDGTEWFDYSVTTAAQVPLQRVLFLRDLTSSGSGNVCKTTPVTVDTPATATTGLLCTANKVTFSPRLAAEFVTGVVDINGPGFVPGVDTSCATPEPFIHGYSVGIPATPAIPAIPATATTPAIPAIPATPATPAAVFTLATAGANPIIPLSGGVLSDGRKLFVGTSTAATGTTTGTAALHRFDLSTGTATTGNLLDGSRTEDMSISIELVPSFVAVVPK